MPVKQPAPGDLDAIESASRDQIEALQLQRLRWTLQHAYDHVPHYRQAFDYWVRLAPDRPKYVILCNFDEFWIYDFDSAQYHGLVAPAPDDQNHGGRNQPK